MPRARLVLPLFLVAVLATTGTAGARVTSGKPPWPDPSFAPQGSIRIGVAGLHLTAADVRLRPGGSIVVLGNGHDPGSGDVTELVVAVLEPDGDGGHQIGSVARIPAPHPDCRAGNTSFLRCQETAGAFEVQDDEVVIAGSLPPPEWSSGVFQHGFLLRAELDGVVDPAFGDGGLVSEDADPDNYFADVAIDSEARIVVAGYEFGDPGTGAQLRRYSSDGVPDVSFSQERGGYHGLTSVHVLPDGTILAAGWWEDEAEIDGFTILVTNPAVVRFLPDGSLDPSFGSGGVVRFELSPPHTENATGGSFSELVVGSDGSIVAAGANEHGVVVARLRPSGTPDPAFGAHGVATFGLGRAGIYGPTRVVTGLVLGADGSVNVSAVGPNDSGLLYQLTRRGRVKGSFGRNGQHPLPFSPEAMRSDDSGRLVIVGHDDGELVVSRYLLRR